MGVEQLARRHLLGADHPPLLDRREIDQFHAGNLRRLGQ
jgi:hypothetical protein